MCDCSGSCSGRRCDSVRGRSCTRPSNACGRCRSTCGRTARATSTRWPACCGICRSNRQCPSRGHSRISSRSRTSPNSTIASGGGATTSAIPRPGHNRHRARRPSRVSLAGDQPGRALRGGVRAADRAGADRPSDRDHASALIHKHLQIAAALMQLDRPDLTVPERAETIDGLRREVFSAWETEEIRPRRPDPLDEVTSGLLIFEQSIWDALPRYLRSLDAALQRTTGRALPLDAAPIRFGSWIGGDRDGNPHVTPEVTRMACLSARWRAADLYLREIDALRLDLSMTEAIPELHARAGGAREPYRAVLRDVHRRLLATRERAGRQLSAHARRARPGERSGATAPSEVLDNRLVDGHTFESADEMVEPLRPLLSLAGRDRAAGHRGRPSRRPAPPARRVRPHAGRARHPPARRATHGRARRHHAPAGCRVVRRMERGAAYGLPRRTAARGDAAGNAAPDGTLRRGRGHAARPSRRSPSCIPSRSALTSSR